MNTIRSLKTRFLALVALAVVAVPALVSGAAIAQKNGATYGVVAGVAVAMAITHSLGLTPTMGANSLGTLSSGVILQRALDLVFTKRPVLQMISTDLSDSAANLNDVVKSRIYSVPTVNDFGSAATAKTDVDVPVTLDQFKEVRHKFTATELSSTNRQLINEAAEPIAVAIANHMVDAVCGLYLAANFSNTATVEAVADCDYNTLTTLRKVLVGRGIDGYRFAIVNDSVYEKLLLDPLCNRKDKSDGGADPVADGELANVAGFKRIFEYPALITTANLIGFAGRKDSAVIATRVPTDPRTVLPNVPIGGNIQVIKSPINGLAVMAIEYIDLADLSANVVLTWIYGKAKGNINAGQLLKSA